MGKSLSMDQSLAVLSSEQEARIEPDGSHTMLFTSSKCPLNVFTGADSPIRHTWISLSVEQVAKTELLFQSTSKQAEECKVNCCLMSPVKVSHTIALLSKLPLSRSVPFLFHFREKTGPECLVIVSLRSPSSVQIRAVPSYEPVANRVPVGFQSKEVTSLPLTGFDGSFPSWWSTFGLPTSVLFPSISQMRAVASPDPEAISDRFGFHAQM